MIDTRGNEILTIDPKAPIYASYIGEDATTDKHAPYKVVDGKFWVGYVNTTPGIPPYEQYYSVLTDMDGNELFVGMFGVGMYGQFEDGVLVCAGNPGVLDIHGNGIVPSRAKVETNGTFAGWFSIGHGRLQDNKTLAKFEGAYGAGDRYYTLELHQGTYTGSGKVYNAATGQITAGGTTDPDPKPTGDKPSSWAEEQVKQAISAGLVPESLQSKYTQTATRAEFCALATALYEAATGTEITQRATFSDTSDVNVEKMAGLGVVGGVGDGKFNPNGQLNREQAATILARLAEALGQPLPAGDPTFADNGSISSWAREAVGQVKAAGIMDGTGGNNFSPLQPYTREQCMMTTLRLFKRYSKSEKSPPQNGFVLRRAFFYSGTAGTGRAGASGKETNTLNRSPSMSISNCPPCSSVRLRAMDRPRPEPSVVRDSSPRTNRSISCWAGIFSCCRETFLMVSIARPSCRKMST